MIDRKFIDELSQRLAQAVPKGAKELGEDVEKNLRAVLHAGFEKLDLVTRQEFEVQTAVLARTRAKLTELEKQVAELESRLRESGTPRD